MITLSLPEGIKVSDIPPHGWLLDFSYIFIYSENKLDTSKLLTLQQIKNSEEIKKVLNLIGDLDILILHIPPQSISETFNFLAPRTPLLKRGFYVEKRGINEGTIEISGETGIFPVFAISSKLMNIPVLSSILDKLKANPFTFLTATFTGAFKNLLGYISFLSMKNFFGSYNKGILDGKYYYLYFIDIKDGSFYEVELNNFNFQRGVDNPFSWSYRITLSILETLKPPKTAFKLQITLLLNLLANLIILFEEFKKFLSGLTGEVFSIYPDFIPKIRKMLNQKFSLTIPEMIDIVYDNLNNKYSIYERNIIDKTGKKPIEIIQILKSYLDSLHFINWKKYDKFTDEMLNYEEYLNYQYMISELMVYLSLFIALMELKEENKDLEILNFVKSKWEEIKTKSSFTQFSVSYPLDILEINEENLIEIERKFERYGVAFEFLGNEKRYFEMKFLSHINLPYIEIANKIKVPTTQEKVNFGTDIKIEKGDIIFTNSGIQLISGIENLKQSLINRIKTEIGSLLFYRNFGLTGQIGELYSPIASSMKNLFINALLGDDRIAEIPEINLKFVGDTIEFKAKLKLTSGENLII